MQVNWNRLAALSGLAVVVLVLASNLLLAPGASARGAAQDLMNVFAAGSSRVLLGAYVDALAVACFLLFAAYLLRLTQPSSGMWSFLVLGGPVLAGALELTVDALLAALTLTSRGGDHGSTVALFALLRGVSYFLGIPNAIFAGSAAMVVVQAKALPSWASWTGGAIAVASLAVGPVGMLVEGLALAGFAVFLLLLLWVAAMSVVLYRRAGMITR